MPTTTVPTVEPPTSSTDRSPAASWQQAEADAVFSGESGGDNAGWSVSGGGDVNGDGIDDLVIGARFESTGASQAGAAYLLEGHSN